MNSQCIFCGTTRNVHNHILDPTSDEWFIHMYGRRRTEKDVGTVIVGACSSFIQLCTYCNFRYTRAEKIKKRFNINIVPVDEITFFQKVQKCLCCSPAYNFED